MILDIRDWHVYGGILALGIGAAFVYAPLGGVVLGISLIALGLFWPTRRR